MNTQVRLGLVATLGVVAMLAISSCNKPQMASGIPSTVTQPSIETTDSEVTTMVKTALLRDPNIKMFDIAVATIKGDVRLTGVVDSKGQIDEVIKLARGIEGVHSIHDELSVKK